MNRPLSSNGARPESESGTKSQWEDRGGREGKRRRRKARACAKKVAASAWLGKKGAVEVSPPKQQNASSQFNHPPPHNLGGKGGEVTRRS